jgi:uncharacterized protein (DUF1015 family)
MADVMPFRAVRYSGAAGSLADLVAPPYDVVDEDERAALYTRSPFNVVHVTLPDTPAEAAQLYQAWLDGGILEPVDADAVWVAVEDYVGPDGVARARHGLVVSVLAEPYETGSVLPHERTHRDILDDRLALLRATGYQPEPILLLTDASLAVEPPERAPDLEVEGTRLWRAGDRPPFDAGQLLIADGHHRYESAVELGLESGRPTRIMALAVSTSDPGLRVFPTHRVFAGRPELAVANGGELFSDLDEALRALDEEPHGRAAAVAYRAGSVEIVRGAEAELDVELVDRHGHEGIRYTPRLEDATAAVDRGEADVAFVVRPPRIADVFAAAREGTRMPQKSTYFHPKPVAGLLFHPVWA